MNIQIGHDAALIESKKKLVSGTYLHNAWYVAAWADELAGGKIIGRTFLNEPVVIYREGNGKLVALDDRCPHRFAPLSMGQVLDGNRIQEVLDIAPGREVGEAYRFLLDLRLDEGIVGEEEAERRLREWWAARG